MTHGSLFSGIGGFDLAAEWMGWNNVFHCEWNEFGQRVLHHYWPQAIQYNDITQTDFTIHRGRIDVLTGGFPCQPYSAAGKRRGKEDERHLWPEMLRAIREIQPRWVVGENVRGLINWNGGLVFDEVQSDLEAEGYEVLPFLVPACGKDAPHRRERIWFVAYSNGSRGNRAEEYENSSKNSRNKEQSDNIDNNGEVRRPTPHTDSDGQQRSNGEHEEHTGQRGINAQRDVEQGVVDGDAADTSSRRMERYGRGGENREFQTNEFNEDNSQGQSRLDWQKFPTQSPICGGDDGLSTELDGITFSKWRNESIKAYGNAVVPQVVYEIFKAIQQYDCIRL